MAVGGRPVARPARGLRAPAPLGGPRAILRARARLAFTPAAGAYSIAPPA